MLLQLPEDEGVVQRRGQKIGQRIQDQNILRRERIFILALYVEHAEQCLAVTDRQAEHGPRFRQDTGKLSRAGVLHQCAHPGARNFSQNSTAHRDPAAQGLRCRSRLRFDLDILGGVVHDADADVIVAEILLDLAHDVSHHLFGVFARYRHFRNAVKKREMPGAALLLGKQARILDCYPQLTGCRLHDLKVPVQELRFPLRTQRRHHSYGFTAQKNRHGAERPGRPRRHEIHSQF